MARSNPIWGEKRNAAELVLTLGLRVPPRGRAKRHVKGDQGGREASLAAVQDACSQSRSEEALGRFLRHDECHSPHFLRLRVLEGSRQPLHCNVTSHPTAAWTCSSSGRSPPRRTPTASSSTIATASTRPAMRCGFSGLKKGHWFRGNLLTMCSMGDRTRQRGWRIYDGIARGIGVPSGIRTRVFRPSQSNGVESTS